MPFAYYGAKHGLAKKYPRPQHPIVVEPFAGSAAYSVHHAASLERVVLVERDPALAHVWRWLIAEATVSDIEARDKDIEAGSTRSILVAGSGGSSSVNGVLGGAARQVTPRMREAWPSVRDRIIRTLPHLRRWEIIEGDYTDAPDIEATWHIDPPYQELRHDYTTSDGSGSAYREGASRIDYARLGSWCQSRRGLVMVCEQSPAAWLPFFPLASQTSVAGVARQELIWRSDFEQPPLFAASGDTSHVP